MKNLYDVICEIIKRPELYIGKPSLERLYAFIGGYLYQNEFVTENCLDGFNEYVAERYGLDTDHNWSLIIQFFSNDEKEAFNKFAQLFDEFCRSKS